MSNFVKQGDNVSVWAQLPDGEINLPKYVQAEIYDNSGNLLDTKNLTHIDCGYFEDTTFIMPLVDFLRVKTKVFDDDQYTKLSKRYGVGQDFYYLSDGLGGGGSGGVDDDCVEILFEFEDQGEINLEFDDIEEIDIELSDSSQEIEFELESEGNVDLLFEDSESEIEILFECYCEGA